MKRMCRFKIIVRESSPGLYEMNLMCKYISSTTDSSNTFNNSTLYYKGSGILRQFDRGNPRKVRKNQVSKWLLEWMARHQFCVFKGQPEGTRETPTGGRNTSRRENTNQRNTKPEGIGGRTSEGTRGHRLVHNIPLPWQPHHSDYKLAIPCNHRGYSWSQSNETPGVGTTKVL